MAPPTLNMPAPELRRLVFAADLAGTFVFATEGALAAIAGGLDLFGVLVLSFATALCGGVARDVLIGAVPPQAIRDWRYPITAFAAGAITFLSYEFLRQVPTPLLVTLDAAGLALFAVAGTEKALAYGLHPFMAILMGGITGVGGGTVRDILLSRVPAILRVDIYATAALAGAAVMLAAQKLGLPASLAVVLGAITCFALRMLSVWQHWQLPHAT